MNYTWGHKVTLDTVATINWTNVMLAITSTLEKGASHHSLHENVSIRRFLLAVVSRCSRLAELHTKGVTWSVAKRPGT